MPTRRGLRHAIVLATLIAGSPARGQELQELDTDRDAFTPATRPVAVGHVLTEASYSFIDNRGTPATNSFPELLIRRGATERFEWRLGFNYESGSGGSVVTAVEGGEGVEGDELASESNILYGFKALVTEQGGWAPRSATCLPTARRGSSTSGCPRPCSACRSPNAGRFTPNGSAVGPTASRTRGRGRSWGPARTS